MRATANVFHSKCRFLLIIVCMIFIEFGSLGARAASDPNLLVLGKGAKQVYIQLPLYPSDPQQRAAFMELSPQQQRVFYLKRKYLIGKLAGGLTKPGIKNGIRWVKEKVTSIGGRIRRRPPVADQVMNALVPDEQRVRFAQDPEHLSNSAKKFVETTVTSLVDTMWKNSADIAKSNGIGVTLVAGAIYNTTFAKWGHVWGRDLSVDIGVDFKNQSGYIRFLYGKQALKQTGMSFDVGLMFDSVVHVTNAELEPGSHILATHVKLPIIGCFRYGPDYKAWGMQLGVSVVEMVGLGVSAVGYPVIGGPLMAGMRLVGMAMVYSTTLDRHVIKTYKVSEKTLRRFGLSGLLDLAQELQEPASDTARVLNCREAMAK